MQTHRVAAMATIGDGGGPFVSMVPFAIDPASARVLVHISQLAMHTANLQADSRVSLLVVQAHEPSAEVHALERVTLEGQAIFLERETPQWELARAVYLARFPSAEMMTQLGDFVFVAIETRMALHVAGFGAARSLDTGHIQAVLKAGHSG